MTEKAGEGTDTVHTEISYVARRQPRAPGLREGGIDGTGNALANEIIGSTGNNKIDGAAGDDNLTAATATTR